MKEVKEAQESGAKKYQTSKAWIIRAGQRRCAITGITTPGSALIAIHSTSLPPATSTTATFTSTYNATYRATYSATYSYLYLYLYTTV